MNVLAKGLAFSLLCLAMQPALATCRYGGNHVLELGPDDPVLEVPSFVASNTVNFWRNVADDLAVLGDELRDWEGTVALHVRITWQPFVETVPYEMSKLCGETFEEAAQRVAESAETSNYGGGGTGGGGPPAGYMNVSVVWNTETWTFSCSMGGTPISCDGD